MDCYIFSIIGIGLLCSLTCIYMVLKIKHHINKREDEIQKRESDLDFKLCVMHELRKINQNFSKEDK